MELMKLHSTIRTNNVIPHGDPEKNGGAAFPPESYLFKVLILVECYTG